MRQNIVILSPDQPPPETWNRLRFFRGVYFIQGTQKSRKDLVGYYNIYIYINIIDFAVTLPCTVMYSYHEKQLVQALRPLFSGFQVAYLQAVRVTARVTLGCPRDGPHDFMMSA